MKISMRIVLVIAMLALAFGSPGNAPAAQPEAWQAKVDPWVLSTAAEGTTEFLVFLKQQADLSGAARLNSKLEKGAYVVQQLRQAAENSQGPVAASLQALGAEHRAYYIANMFWVRGDLSVVEAMASRLDVLHIYANPWVKMEQPVSRGTDQAEPGSPDAIEWNITKVNAPQVWAAGYTGQGAVIGGQDTGYDWDHPALQQHYRGWNDGLVNHNYNWHDAIHTNNSHTPPGNPCGFDSPVPCDDDSHGTHTMGTMVGDDPTHTNQIGMAPGAQWIGCRNMEEGWGQPSTYAECYEWFIAPYPLGGTPAQGDPSKAPDAINNSWGCPADEGCTDPNALLTIVNNVRAAGIVTVHSAGNSGPSCSTVNTPAAIYDASYSVAATSSTDSVASFSSRGPVTVDGSNRLKPDISAPGVSIRSSVPGGGYAGGWSGTSMAAPHVAGAVALLISQEPDLAGHVTEIENLLNSTALPRQTSEACGGTNGQIPNNVYGWGRFDALAAYQANQHHLEISKTASSQTVVPGSLITYTLTTTHTHLLAQTTNLYMEDQLPTNVSLVSAQPAYTLVGNTVRWHFASLAANSNQTAHLVVRVNQDASGQVVNDTYQAFSDDVLSPVSGAPVQTEIITYGLALKKSAPATVAPGETLTYTLTVTNTSSNGTAHNVVLTDTLPAGVTFVSASTPNTFDGNRVRWDFPSLAPAAAQTVELVVQVPALASGSIENSDYAVRSAQVPDAIAGPIVSTQVQAIPGIILAPNYLAHVAPGQVVTYTHTLVNSGTGSDTISLTLDSSLGWGSLVGPTSTLLGPGTSTEVLVVVMVPAAAAFGLVETTVLTGTSTLNPSFIATVENTTQVRQFLLWPVMLK
jgi:uncharacterized repeat protein (TIGR01451 family)